MFKFNFTISVHRIPFHNSVRYKNLVQTLFTQNLNLTLI